jgi:hypothetical protein
MLPAVEPLLLPHGKGLRASPAVGLDEGVSAEGQTAHLGQPDADLGTYWDMAAFRPDSVKHKMSA